MVVTDLKRSISPSNQDTSSSLLCGKKHEVDKFWAKTRYNITIRDVGQLGLLKTDHCWLGIIYYFPKVVPPSFAIETTHIPNQKSGSIH